jgi:hypothetical protein
MVIETNAKQINKFFFIMMSIILIRITLSLIYDFLNIATF